MRAAIYFTPTPDSSLAIAASSWLGRDVCGNRVTNQAPAGLDVKRHTALLKSPFHYGFHATIKPPFRLRHDKSLDQLRNELTDYCAQRKPFTLPPLEVDFLHSFFCLRPTHQPEALIDLADDTVRQFDHFRKEPDLRELQRRRKSGLTQRQEALLKEWGYPYVFDQFRFHLTLTGTVENDGERILLTQHLNTHFPAAVCKNIDVSCLSLFLENDGEPLILDSTYSFSGREL